MGTQTSKIWNGLGAPKRLPDFGASAGVRALYHGRIKFFRTVPPRSAETDGRAHSRINCPAESDPMRQVYASTRQPPTHQSLAPGRTATTINLWDRKSSAAIMSVPSQSHASICSATWCSSAGRPFHRQTNLWPVDLASSFAILCICRARPCRCGDSDWPSSRPRTPVITETGTRELHFSPVTEVLPLCPASSPRSSESVVSRSPVIKFESP
eukprot:scaffold48_cov311-Pinguiococcus_pyrenoidosus.AAC.166